MLGGQRGNFYFDNIPQIIVTNVTVLRAKTLNIRVRKSTKEVYPVGNALSENE